MASAGDLPWDFRAGDELTSEIVAAIVQELWRLRKMDAMPPLAIDFADSDEPPLFSFTDPGNTIPALTSGAVAGGSYGSPTSFTADVLILGGADAALTTSTGLQVTAYNPFSGSIGSGVLVWLKFVYGYWYVIAASC